MLLAKSVAKFQSIQWRNPCSKADSSVPYLLPFSQDAMGR